MNIMDINEKPAVDGIKRMTRSFVEMGEAQGETAEKMVSTDKVMGKITEHVDQLTTAVGKHTKIMRESIELSERGEVYDERTKVRALQNLTAMKKEIQYTERLAEIRGRMLGAKQDMYGGIPAGADPVRASAYFESIRKAEEYIAKHNISLAQVEMIWDNIRSGEALTRYTGELSTVQSKLMNIENTYRILSESAEKATAKREAFARTLEREAEAAARKRQVITAANVVSNFKTRLGAPPEEMTPDSTARLNDLFARLRTTIENTKGSYAQIVGMGKQVVQGTVKDWGDGLNEVQRAMLDIIALYSKEDGAIDKRIAKEEQAHAKRKKMIGEQYMAQVKADEKRKDENEKADADMRSRRAETDARYQAEQAKEAQAQVSYKKMMAERYFADVKAAQKRKDLQEQYEQGMRDRTAVQNAAYQKQMEMDEQAHLALKRRLGLEHMIAEAKKRQALEVGTAVKRIDKGMGVPKDASPERLMQYYNILNSVESLANKHNITVAELMNIWNRVLAGGAPKRYSGAMAEIQERMYKLKAAHTAATGSMIRDTKRLNAEATKFNGIWGRSLRMLAVSVGYRAIGYITKSIREAFDLTRQLEKGLAEIGTITQRQPMAVSEWRRQLKGLSSDFGLPIMEQVQGAYKAISNQVVTASQSMSFMRTASRLAITTQADLATSVNAISSIMNSFGLSTLKAEEIATTLFKTSEYGRVKLEEMGDTIGRTAPLVAQLGADYRELFSMIAALTVQGLPFERSQTQILGIMNKLVKPTTEMSKLFAKLGVKDGPEAIKAFGGIKGVLEQIVKATGGSITELGKLFPDIRGFGGVIALTGTASDNFTKSMKGMQDATKEFDAAVALTVNNIGKSMERFKADVVNKFEEHTRVLSTGFVDLVNAMGGVDAIINGTFVASLGVATYALTTYDWATKKATASTWALTLAQKANPLTGAILLAAAAIIGAYASYKHFVEEADPNDEWYSNWVKAFERFGKINQQAYEAATEVALSTYKVLDTEIAQIQQQRQAGVYKAISDNLTALVSVGKTASGIWSDVTFDYSSALKEIIKVTKESVDIATKEVEKYASAIKTLDGILSGMLKDRLKETFTKQVELFDKQPKSELYRGIIDSLGRVSKAIDPILTRQNHQLRLAKAIFTQERETAELKAKEKYEEKVKTLAPLIKTSAEQSQKLQSLEAEKKRLEELLKIDQHKRVSEAKRATFEKNTEIKRLERRKREAKTEVERYDIEKKITELKESLLATGPDTRTNAQLRERLKLIDQESAALIKQQDSTSAAINRAEDERKATPAYKEAEVEQETLKQSLIKLRDSLATANAEDLADRVKQYQDYYKRLTELEASMALPPIVKTEITGVWEELEKREAHLKEEEAAAILVLKAREKDLATLERSEKVLSEISKLSDIILSGETSDELKLDAARKIDTALHDLTGLTTVDPKLLDQHMPMLEMQLRMAKSLTNEVGKQAEYNKQIAEYKAKEADLTERINAAVGERTAAENVVSETLSVSGKTIDEMALKGEHIRGSSQSRDNIVKAVNDNIVKSFDAIQLALTTKDVKGEGFNAAILQLKGLATGKVAGAIPDKALDDVMAAEALSKYLTPEAKGVIGTMAKRFEEAHKAMIEGVQAQEEGFRLMGERTDLTADYRDMIKPEEKLEMAAQTNMDAATKFDEAVNQFVQSLHKPEHQESRDYRDFNMWKQQMQRHGRADGSMEYRLDGAGREAHLRPQSGTIYSYADPTDGDRSKLPPYQPMGRGRLSEHDREQMARFFEGTTLPKEGFQATHGAGGTLDAGSLGRRVVGEGYTLIQNITVDVGDATIFGEDADRIARKLAEPIAKQLKKQDFRASQTPILQGRSR